MSSVNRCLERKTWADRKGFKTGVWGEYIDGIEICEKNRATVFEFRPEGIQGLYDLMHQQYRRKGVKCVLFGVWLREGIGYAIFLKPGFLTEVGEDE